MMLKIARPSVTMATGANPGDLKHIRAAECKSWNSASILSLYMRQVDRNRTSWDDTASEDTR